MSGHRLSPSKTRIAQLVVAIAATGVIAYYLARSLSYDIFLSAGERLQMGYLIAGVGAYLTVTALRALRFTVAGAPISFGTAFKIAAVHSALLRVMPLRSGELAYGILLKRMGKSSLGEGVAVIVMLRILDLVVICPMAAVVVGTVLTGADAGQPVTVLVIAAVVLAVAFFALGPIARTLDRRFAGAQNTAPGRLFGNMCRTLSEVTDLPLKRRLWLLGLTCVMWIGVLAWFHLTLLGIGLGLPLLDGIAVGALGVSGSILPVSLLGSFGPMEGGFALGLAAIGAPVEAAATHAVVASACTFVTNWIVALPAWMGIRLTGHSR